MLIRNAVRLSLYIPFTRVKRVKSNHIDYAFCFQFVNPIKDARYSSRILYNWLIWRGL